MGQNPTKYMQNTVKIHTHNNYEGSSAHVGLGNYKQVPFISQISSIKIPHGLTVHLYEKPNYLGALWVIKGPYNCNELYSHKRIWTNQPKSLKVMQTPSAMKEMNFIIEGMTTDQVNQYGLINNGLQCYLDARQPASYGGQGALWKDLSGHNRNFNWNIVPQYSNGRFKFIEGSTATGPASNSFELGDGKKGYVIIVVSRQITMSANRVFHFKPQTPANFGISVHQTWNSNVTYFDNMAITPVGQNRLYTDIGDRWNQTCVWAYVRTASGNLKIYCNSQLLATTQIPALPLKLSNDGVIINEAWNADLSLFAVYNNELTSEQIKSITDWWYTSEKLRIAEREGNMANKIIANVPNFPVPYGLQCYLDINYSNSYSPDSLEFKDLTPYGRNFKFQSKPNVVGNRIITPGNNLLVGPMSNSFNIDENDDYSILWYAKTNVLNQNAAFQFFDVDPKGWGIFCHPTWTDQTLYYNQVGCCNSDTRLTASVQGYWNQMCLYALVRDSTGRHIYINGNKVASNSYRGLPLNFNKKAVNVLGTGNSVIWNCEFTSFMVYNVGLNISQIKNLYQWVNNGYEFKPFSWSEAKDYCLNQGQRLCNYRDYCPEGPMESPIYKAPKGDQWAPVADSINQWVQISDPARMCQLHTTLCEGPNQYCGADGKPLWGVKSGEIVRPLLCCDTPKTQIYFDTIGQISDDMCMIFKDKVYIKYNIKTHLSTDVIAISTLNLEGAFTEGRFQACVEYPTKNELYIFKGNLIIAYNYVKNTTSQPMAINIVYPGLSLLYQKGNFDTCLRIDNTQLAIFKGNQVVIYNETNNTASAPINIIKYWPGLTSIFAMGQLNAIIKKMGKLCLFKENLYAWYQPTTTNLMEGPFNIVPDWSGLKVPFIKESEQCLIYNTLLSYLKNNNVNKIYDEQIKNYNRLLDEKCNFISYGEYMMDLRAKKDTLENLKKQILDGQLNYGQKTLELNKINDEIKSLNEKIRDLTIKMDIEKNKPCDVNSKCKYNPTYIKQTYNQNCNRRIMINILRKQGVSEVELKKVQPYLSYQPGVNNFKIETHPDFYKYSKIPQISSCHGLTRQATNTNENNNDKTQKKDLIGQILDDVNSPIDQQKQVAEEKQHRQTTQAAEQQTLDIFKKALDQYGRIIIDQNTKNMDMDNWREKAKAEAKQKGLDLSEEELELLAIGLQITDNLMKTKQILFDSGKILHYIIHDPKFKKLLNDINNLNMLMRIKKQELEAQQKKLNDAKKYNLIDQIKIILANNNLIISDIETIQSNIFNKTSEIKNLL